MVEIWTKFRLKTTVIYKDSYIYCNNRLLDNLSNKFLTHFCEIFNFSSKMLRIFLHFKFQKDFDKSFFYK